MQPHNRASWQISMGDFTLITRRKTLMNNENTMIFARLWCPTLMFLTWATCRAAINRQIKVVYPRECNKPARRNATCSAKPRIWWLLIEKLGRDLLQQLAPSLKDIHICYPMNWTSCIIENKFLQALMMIAWITNEEEFLAEKINGSNLD